MMSEHLLNFHDTVLLATGFQSLLFILLILFVKHDRRISDYFLIGFFVAQIAIPLHVLINYSVLIREAAIAYSLNLPFIFDIAIWLEGPLLLWYTRSVLNKNFALRKKDALYLIPSLGYLIFISLTFYSLTNDAKIEFLAAQEEDLQQFSQLAAVTIRESFRVFFGFLCLNRIQQARKELKDHFSSIEKVDIRWLSVLVIAFTAVRAWILLVMIASFYAPNLGESIFNFMGLVGNYLTFALITALMFLSLQRSSFFEDHVREEVNEAATPDVDSELALKIEKNAIKIADHMHDTKPYLNTLLNLDQLASQLSMHPRAVSLAIKTHHKTNFYEFVNSYRINEALTILSDPEQKHKTMIEISGECGFNSKATYNTFFKKVVGSTPTQYRKNKLSE